MDDLLEKLKGGDRRSIGRVNEVVSQVFEKPGLFKIVFNGMLSGDPIVRMRSADAVEKITAEHPEYLQPYKKKLIQEIAKIEQHEVRWHVAQLLPRLTVSDEEQSRIVTILLDYLDDKSKIVKAFSMEALAAFAERDSRIRSQIIPLLEELTTTGSPAMTSRGRKLLKRLNRKGNT
jgi:hypothetical protein